MIYLDNAATTLVKPQGVSAAVMEALVSCGNAGRGAHQSAVAASNVLFSCREIAGILFGQSNPEQIVFTHNTTHALNLAIFGTMHRGGHCLISGYEHNSVVRPICALKDRGLTYTAVQTPLFDQERLLDEFVKCIRSDTKYAVCTCVSNVFGYILPIQEIDEICFENGITLILDAAQSAGCIPVKINQLKSTACICAPGHKGLYGPQGTGLLICRDGAELSPILYGGTGSASNLLSQPDFMPDRHESGTQNIHGIAGLRAGMEYVLSRGEESIFRKEHDLIQYAAENLKTVDGLTVFSGTSQAGVLSFLSDRVMPESIAEFLSENDIAVRGGLHCSALAHRTVGTVNGCVRISVSDFNSEHEIDTLIDVLRKL